MVYNTPTTVCDKPTHKVEILPKVDIKSDSNSGVYSALQFIKDEHSKWKGDGSKASQKPNYVQCSSCWEISINSCVIWHQLAGL